VKKKVITRLANVPNEFRAYINSVRSKARRYGVKIVLLSSETKKATNYFQTWPSKKLCVEVTDNVYDWISAFIHEACHMDQEYGATKVSKRMSRKWNGAYARYDDWKRGKLTLSEKEIEKLVDRMVECERDCELRAIEKIKEWELPISIRCYSQQANVYLYSYQIFRKFKQFIPDITTSHKVNSLAPYSIQKDHKVIPIKLKVALDKRAIRLINNQIAA
jgi:hypothetical protein